MWVPPGVGVIMNPPEYGGKEVWGIATVGEVISCRALGFPATVKGTWCPTAVNVSLLSLSLELGKNSTLSLCLLSLLLLSMASCKSLGSDSFFSSHSKG